MRHAATLSIMRACQQIGLINDLEIAAAVKLVGAGSPFERVLDAAESLHVHLKVDDTATLPRDAFEALGGVVDFEKAGFVKFRFPGDARLICSSIAVSQDELAEEGVTRKTRPFVDHFGVDLREATAASRKLFDAVPENAQSLAWNHVPQGGDGGGVHCCHTQVEAKHWVYPSTDWDTLSVPIEFAFGPLEINAEMSGCDLRPTNPAKQPSCGTTGSDCCKATG